MENLFVVGGQVNLISDLLRSVSIVLDIMVYSCIPLVFNLIYKLYDISSFIDASNVLKMAKESIYSLLAIYMFFKVAFSLLGMLVDPNKIDDKEKGAGKIVTNIVITLILIVAIPMAFRYAREIQTKIMKDQIIEKAIYGADFNSLGGGSVSPKDGNIDYTLGNSLSKSVFSIFLQPIAESGLAVTAYDKIFNSNERNFLPWFGLYLTINLTTGVPILSGIVAKLAPGLNGFANLFGAGVTYQLSYIYIISNIVGIWLIWTMIKLCIDVAYRALKLLALELISPIAIFTYIDPKSSKDGVFAKWLKETVKTYTSLFVRIFVFAFISLLLHELDITDRNTGPIVTLMYLFAIISFIKVGPKFIDNIFGTELSKESDTKFASDMLRGAFGAVATGAVGGIVGGKVAKRTGQNAFKGFAKGAMQGGSKGFAAARKGDMRGVVSGFTDTVGGIKKGYGYNYDKEYDRELAKMSHYIPGADAAKAKAAFAGNDAAKRAAYKEFLGRKRKTKDGSVYDLSHLESNDEAYNSWGKYRSVLGMNEYLASQGVISSEYANAKGNASFTKLETELAGMIQKETSADFTRRVTETSDADKRKIVINSTVKNVSEADKRVLVQREFNLSNEQASSIDIDTVDEMVARHYESADMNIIDRKFKSIVDNDIKETTGFGVDMWGTAASNKSSDADAAKSNVERVEKGQNGPKDKHNMEMFNAAKAKSDAEKNAENLKNDM